MKKEFNTVGVCYSKYHYMMDNSRKLESIMELIEQGKYVTISRPRQFGKTTTLHFLMNYLGKTEEYLAIRLTFEDVTDVAHQSDNAFAQMFMKRMVRAFRQVDQTIYNLLKKLQSNNLMLEDLSDAITDMVHSTDKKLVLLIDEVDASSNYSSFLKFLAMLRTKYLNREDTNDYTFHSIILAGVHNIKSLKYKRHNSQELQYNSPWNIAIDFEANMSFQPNEIAPMLEEYCTAENVKMNIAAISKKMFYHTFGYPYLVSSLCKVIAKDILPKRAKQITKSQRWTLEDVESAVQILLLENNTNFDSLIKNLENHRDLYELSFRILIEGDKIIYNPHNSVIQKGKLYGVFKRNGYVKIHNRIYEQLIYNYMTSNIEVGLNKVSPYNFEGQFYLPNNELDIEKILLKFQEFMQMEYSEQDQKFLEREWRLIFLAFIRPIVNGRGHTFKEPQISQEKRLDVVITFFQHQYIVELKRWEGQKYHQEGINQLCDYLEVQKLTKGFLVIFEYRTQKTWRKMPIKREEKEVFAVWV